MSSHGPREPARYGAARSLEVLTAAEAVLRFERSICQDAVTHRRAAAEGLARTGVRAASFVEEGEAAVGGAGPPLAASCVHHRVATGPIESEEAFELWASNAEEALEDCLVAHRLSLRIGRSGRAVLPARLAGELAVVRWPQPHVVERMLDADGVERTPAAATEKVAEWAEEAFRALAEASGRAVDPVRLEGDPDASVVLAARGEQVAVARRVVRALREAGGKAAAIALRLLQPFPEAAVRSVLPAGASVFAIADEAGGRDFARALRAALGSATPVHEIPTRSASEVLAAVLDRVGGASFAKTPALPPDPPLGSRLLVAPAGAWGEETLRAAAAALARLGELRLAPRPARLGGAVLLRFGAAAVRGEGDLLLASHPALLGRPGLLDWVRARGAVVVLSADEDADDFARAIAPPARGAIRSRGLRVYALSASPFQKPQAERPGVDDPGRAASLALAGAAVGLLAGGLEEVDRAAVGRVAEALAGEGREAEARLVEEGAGCLRPLAPAALDPTHLAEEIDFRPPPSHPRLPAPPPQVDPATKRRWEERIHRFHWRGEAPLRVALGVPVRPAAWLAVERALGADAQHPFALLLEEGSERPVRAEPLGSLLSRALEAIRASGRAARVLGDKLAAWVEVADEALKRRGAELPLASLVRGAGEELARRLALPEAEKEELAADLNELAQKLPQGWVFALERSTPLRVHRRVVETIRGQRLSRKRAEIERLREGLRDRLELDRARSPQGRDPAALAAGLGPQGSQRLDLEALARTLPRTAGSRPLAEERRGRIEAALATLERWSADEAWSPKLAWVHPPGLEPPADLGGERHPHDDPLAAAVGVYEGLARRVTELVRALRVARLELEEAYLPERHDEALAGLDWEGFTPEELALVPPVVAITTGERARGRDQRSLSETLRSSRPVQVLVLDATAPRDETARLQSHVELAQLLIAHREAQVVSSTLARPEAFVAGLATLAAGRRPGVVRVCLPLEHAETLWPLLAEAAAQGRVCPELRYDPDAGSSWADRLVLAGNPQNERPWPLHVLEVEEQGEKRALEVAFTFADAMALEPVFEGELRSIPLEAWSENQVPLAEYLVGFDPARSDTRIPYIWMLDESGTLQRAVLTRAFTLRCHDRLRAWEALRELAGFDNVFAQRAAAQARAQAEAEAEARIASLSQQHAEEIERVRLEATRDAMARLAAALLAGGGERLALAPASASGPATSAATVGAAADAGAEATEAEPAPQPPAAEEEESLGFDEPYVDSALCTSCNECTNINSQLFRYNADKQAYIADPSAGTFEELVRAAEQCPARCIHPGKPRSDDPTATPEWIERAARFQ